MTFLTIFRVIEILRSCRLILEGKTGKEIPNSTKLRLELLEKLLANNCTLPDAEGNTSAVLNRGGITDFLLLITLLAICQMSWQPNFWELKLILIEPFFHDFCRFSSFKNPFTMITSLPYFCFRFRRFVLLVQLRKVIAMNYSSIAGSLKTMKMSEAWPDIFDERYIHQF